MTDENTIALKALALYHEAKSKEMEKLVSHLKGVTGLLFRQAVKPVKPTELPWLLRAYGIDAGELKVFEDKARMLFEEGVR